MKNILKLAVGAISLFTGTLFAQDPTLTVPLQDYHKGLIGFRFMPTVSSMEVQSSDGVYQADFTLGYGIGGLIGVNFNKHVGAQLEVQYNKLSQKYVDRDLDKRIDVDYVNIPLLLSLNTNRMGPVNLNFVVGPQLGINVGSHISATGTNAEGTEFTAVLGLKQTDFGIAYGFGLDFGLGERKATRLDLGFRGLQGIVDISDNSRTLETNEYYILQKSFLKTYAIYAGLTFLIF